MTGSAKLDSALDISGWAAGFAAAPVVAVVVCPPAAAGAAEVVAAGALPGVITGTGAAWARRSCSVIRQNAFLTHRVNF